MKRIHPVLIRYILIFLLFSLFLFVFFVPVYRYISDFTLKNELSYIYDKLYSGVAAIDSTVRALNNMVIATSGDSRFRIFKYDTPGQNYNPYTLRELQNTLNNLILSQSLIADVGIVFSGESALTRQRIFLSTAQYSFYGQFLSCENLSYEQWLGLLLSQRPFVSVREYSSWDYGAYRAVSFSASWDATNYPEQAVLFATLPVKNIVPLLADEEVAAGGSLRIYNIGGRLLMEETGGPPSDRLHILEVQSAVTSLRFEVGVPDSLVMEKMRPVKNMVLAFSLLMAVSTVFLSLLFAHKSAEPLRRFLGTINATKNIRSEYGGNEPQWHSGALKSFTQIFSDLTASIITVDARLEDSLQTIEQQARYLKTQIFNMALQGATYSAEDLRRFQTVFSGFPEQFQLADIRYRRPGSYSFEEILARQMKLIALVKDYMDHNLFGNIYVQSKDDNIILLLLPLSGGEDPWYTRLQALRNELNPQVDVTLSFALSEVFDRPSDLSRAWQQLQFIHILRGSNYMTGVERIKDIPADNIHLPLNITMLEMIYNSLNNANDATACSILRDCVALLPESPEPEDELISNIIHSRLSNMIMQLKLENPAVLFDINIPAYVQGSRQDLFGRQFPECFRQICERIRNQSQNSITKFGQEIIDYINKHLYDPELYITMISGHFNISPPTLQKLVKKISGQTFLVYVETQRLTKAYEMLQAGNRTIQEVAAQCGFSKADSFYKAFKRSYGFPPSDILNRRTV
jgi:AraC-like DNA-binding protein